MIKVKKNTSFRSDILRAGVAFAAALVALTILLPATLVAEVTPEAKNYKVKLFKSFLSVNAQEAAFGDIMSEVAGKVGFELVISPDIAEKTLTTNFSDVEVQRGIQRLLALINHKNYFMHYGREGNIKKLEIYGSVSPSTVRSLPTPPAPGDVPTEGPVMPRQSMPEDGSVMPPGMEVGQMRVPEGAMVESAPPVEQPQMQPMPAPAPIEEAKLVAPEAAMVKYPYLKPAQMPAHLPDIKRF